MKIRVGGYPVLGSGAVVTERGQDIDLLFFDDDPDFTVKLRFDFEEDVSESTVSLLPVGEKTQLIIFKQKFHMGNSFSTRKPIYFADSDDERTNYFLNVSAHTIGSLENATIVVSYTAFGKAA